MTKDLLKKYLNNQCSEAELQIVLDWIKNDSLDDKSLEIGWDDWESFRSFDNKENKDLELLIHKIHHKINIQKKKTLKTERLINWISRIAAVLLLPVAGLLFYVLAEQPDKISQNSDFAVDSMEIVAPVGSKAVVQLSDGSTVYLNHGSKLKYPQRFDNKKREVILTGEGYFKVVEDKNKPFIVKANGLDVTALGTEFNVMAYPGEKNVETTLVTGKVVLQQLNADRKMLGKMVPGQHVEYEIKSEKIYSTQVDVDKYVGWKDGKLVFKNESIVEIINRLERWYNVDFEFKDEESKQYTYTATFVDETLYQILDLLKIATPINYRKLPREKLSDGTFSKQRIIIEKRNLTQ